MLTKTMIGKKSDAHDSKESSHFASHLNNVVQIFYIYLPVIISKLLVQKSMNLTKKLIEQGKKAEKVLGTRSRKT